MCVCQCVRVTEREGEQRIFGLVLLFRILGTETEYMCVTVYLCVRVTEREG